MPVLVVAATEAEIAGTIAALGRSSEHHDTLITGVGMVATAAQCARVLSKTGHDVVLNLGLCGSFDRSFPPGTVVHVTSDRIAELGAEDGERFLPVDELGLLQTGECAELTNPRPPTSSALSRLPAVRGITVNTVHGGERSIAEAVARFAPQVESMEGAAVMYTCTMLGLRFAQVRAVSNMVERRNRGAWKMAEAIDALTRAAIEIIGQL